SDHQHVLDAVTGFERIQHRDDRVSLCSVARKGMNLQWEPVLIDQQPHQHLWIDAAFLAEPDLAVLIFLISLEVESGDVIETDTDHPVGGLMGVGGSAESITPVFIDASAQSPPDRAQLSGII